MARGSPPPAAALGLALSLAAAALLAPPAGAQPRLAGGAQLQADALATLAESTVQFPIPFRLDADREAYVKVSPRPGNAAFANGTTGVSGWWTEVRLTSPGGGTLSGNLSGDEPLELGLLAGNATHALLLIVHVPAGALASPGRIPLDYVLASRSAGGTGSGGSFDPSVGLHLTIHVLGPDGDLLEAAETVDPSEDEEEDRAPRLVSVPPGLLYGLAGGFVAALALAAFAVVLLLRRRSGPG